MTLAPFSLLASLTTILSLISNVSAGAIARTSQGITFSEGQFTSYIPAHIAQFAVDERGDCYGEEIIGDCVETIDKSDGAQISTAIMVKMSSLLFGSRRISA